MSHPWSLMYPVEVVQYHLRIWAKVTIIVIVLSPLVGAALGIGIVEGQRFLHSKEYKKFKEEIAC